MRNMIGYSNMRGYIVALAAAGVALFLSFDARALDAPHDVANPTTSEAMLCAHCHTLHGSTYPTILGQVCQSCHVTGGPAEGPGGQYVVQTHSSRFIDNSYGDWEVDCWGCHDPHTQWQERDFGATRGVFLRRYLNAQIKEVDPNCTDPYCAPLSTLRTESGTDIQFDAASTPAKDFVDNDAESIDDICRTCHLNTTNHNKSGAPFHTDYGTDTQPLGNCTACHSHANGFAVAGGGGCTGCHSSLQGTKATPGNYRRQVVGTGGDFSRASHHVTDGTATEIVADSDCQVCHKQDNHQNNTPPDQVLLYDVDDPTGVTDYTYNGTGASIEPFCLSCHDANAANGSTPFSDGRTPPDIESLWTATGAPHVGLTEKCVACHGGSDSTDPALPDYEHNIHGSCGDLMLSTRVVGVAVPPNVAIVRIDATGRDFIHQINVDGIQIAQYTAVRTDTPDIVRTALINEINAGAHGQPVSAEIFGSIDDQVLLAVIPDDICNAFATIDGTGSTAGGTTVIGKVPTSSYVCLQCHDADGPSTHNIAAQFDSTTGGALSGFILSQEFGTLLSRTHDVPTAINCNNCHDPHGPNGLGFELLSTADPRYKWRTLRADPDPDDPAARPAGDIVPGDSDDDGIPDSAADGRLWTNPPTPSIWLTEWCLACHDGSMPPSVSPPGPLVDIADAWLNAASANPNAHGIAPYGAGSLVCQSGYVVAGGCTTPLETISSGGQNAMLNCINCHNAGHNADSGLYQTRYFPLAADGTPLTIRHETGGGQPLLPYISPTDGQFWCRGCHDTNMNNDCQGCHQHGDASRF